MSKTIILTKGYVATVDDAMYDLVAPHKWIAAELKEPTGTILTYARRTVNKKTVAMSRLIMEHHLGRTLDRLEYVDHINHNTLDNRLENLRVVTPTQSQYNRRGWGKTKYQGVRKAVNKNGTIRYFGELYVAGKSYITPRRDSIREAYQDYLDLRMEKVGI